MYQIIWNASASNLICEYAKKNSEVLNIMGGPEFPAGTGKGQSKILMQMNL